MNDVCFTKNRIIVLTTYVTEYHQQFISYFADEHSMSVTYLCIMYVRRTYAYVPMCFKFQNYNSIPE